MASSCKYWRDPQVTEYLKKHSFVKVSFHGCAYGLKDSKGNFMKKPWTVATNSQLVASGLDRKCDRTHVHVVGRGQGM